MDKSESKSKCVDHLLAQYGYKESERFYSPLSNWLLMIFIAIGTSQSLVFTLVGKIYANFDLRIASLIFIISLVYLSIGYLILAKLNHSFAVTSDHFIAINSHKPFTKVQVFFL